MGKEEGANVMNRTMGTAWVVAASVITSAAGVCWAQDVDKGKTILQIETGKANYENSCASCHGINGKGHGPISSQLKALPSNLTLLAKKNNGVFPFHKVYEVIDGRQAVLAHGPRDMPIWGLRYRPSDVEKMQNPASSPFDPDAVVRARILSIVDYLNQIQEK
jgi:mono/diheme cytochrome c family protein